MANVVESDDPETFLLTDCFKAFGEGVGVGDWVGVAEAVGDAVADGVAEALGFALALADAVATFAPCFHTSLPLDLTTVYTYPRHTTF